MFTAEIARVVFQKMLSSPCCLLRELHSWLLRTRGQSDPGAFCEDLMMGIKRNQSSMRFPELRVWSRRPRVMRWLRLLWWCTNVLRLLLLLLLLC